MEILNRREQIGAKKLPPEIPDVDTLVTKTDYATASKAGVVKIGSNINVSSGKISVPAASDETAGVVKVGNGLEVDENGALNVTEAGGVTYDELFSGTVVQGSSSIHNNLSKPYTDYKALQLVYVSGVNMTSGTPLVVSCIQTGNLNSNSSGLSNLASLRFDPEDATYFTVPSGSGNVTTIKVYGIK